MTSQDTVLITGGAGFIGSHLADCLLASGYRVRVLDSLVAPVHGGGEGRPHHLHPDVELLVGDVRDSAAVERALQGIDHVVHLAAAVGVGHSLYQIHDYVDVNVRGTAVLLEALKRHPVRRLLVASSMCIYGEGLYRGARDAHLARSPDDLRQGRWEHYGEDGAPLEPLPTPETKRPEPASVYALNKYDQERMCLMVGQAYGIPTVAMRFFNVYGTRQALSNPYSGVLAVFASRLLNGKPPLIFEDGLQRRDFVHVKDVARACVAALETPSAVGKIFNVGSGKSYPVRDIARAMAEVMDKAHIQPEVTGNYRVGDVRHCFADTSLARTVLGFHATVTLEEGLAELAEWLGGQVKGATNTEPTNGALFVGTRRLADDRSRGKLRDASL